MKIKLFTVLTVLVFPATPVASENIRVAIADNQRTVTLKSPSGLLTAGTSADGREKELLFKPESVSGKPVRVRSTDGSTRVNGKSYRGWVELRKNKNGLLLVINELDIEEYLNGVIASEIPHEWEFEALKAQAVAARTYAFSRKRASGNRPYHVLATISSQVYNGIQGERPNTVRAVKDTKGLVLTYRGEVISAFYHSSCGGQTENASELWDIDAPYLKGVDCECQAISKYGLWEKRISTSMVSGALRRMGYRVEDISDMSIGTITPAGRVKDVSIRSSAGTSRVSGEALRAALGSTALPSVFFELELSGNEAVFSGRGNGHGAGMCQWGAKEMAQRGYDFKAILSHYYPGTDLARMK